MATTKSQNQSWRDYFPSLTPGALGKKPYLVPGYGLSVLESRGGASAVTPEAIRRYYSDALGLVRPPAESASPHFQLQHSRAGGGSADFRPDIRQAESALSFLPLPANTNPHFSLQGSGTQPSRVYPSVPEDDAALFKARDTELRAGLRPHGGFSIGKLIASGLMSAGFGLLGTAPLIMKLPGLVSKVSGFLGGPGRGSAPVTPLTPPEVGVPGDKIGTDSKVQPPSVLGLPVQPSAGLGAARSRTGAGRRRGGRAATILSEDFAGRLGG